MSTHGTTTSRSRSSSAATPKSPEEQMHAAVKRAHSAAQREHKSAQDALKAADDEVRAAHTAEQRTRAAVLQEYADRELERSRTRAPAAYARMLEARQKADALEQRARESGTRRDQQAAERARYSAKVSEERLGRDRMNWQAMYNDPRNTEAKERTQAAIAAKAAAEQRVGDTKSLLEQAREDLGRAAAVLDYSRGGTGIQLQMSAADRRAARSVLGASATPETYARLLDAQPGDVVTVRGHGRDDSYRASIGIMSENARSSVAYTLGRLNASAARTAGLPTGSLIITEATVRNLGGRTTASGAHVIDSFRVLTQLGVARIYSEAARGASLNGYYTWARLGAHGDIPVERMSEQARSELQSRFPGVTTVQDLMRQPGGPAWWKANGDSFQATMDLLPGGDTRAILDSFSARRGR